MSSAVVQWAGFAQEAQTATGIPGPVLLGLTDVESGGVPGRTSSAGAKGITQFIDSTARSYGVDTRPGHERSQLMGTARYLVDLGYHQDPAGALARYNAGPNASGAGLAQGKKYAQTVLARAASYGTVKASPGTSPGTSSAASSGTSPGTDRGPWALRLLLGVTLTAAGVALVVAGGGRMLGVKVSKVAAAVAAPEAAAAKAAV